MTKCLNTRRTWIFDQLQLRAKRCGGRIPARGVGPRSRCGMVMGSSNVRPHVGPRASPRCRLGPLLAKTAGRRGWGRWLRRRRWLGWRCDRRRRRWGHRRRAACAAGHFGADTRHQPRQCAQVKPGSGFGESGGEVPALGRRFCAGRARSRRPKSERHNEDPDTGPWSSTRTHALHGSPP